MGDLWQRDFADDEPASPGIGLTEIDHVAMSVELDEFHWSKRQVLLDGNAQGGRYLQLYSRALDRRFFFEIVERSNYTGFGARNAPVRLAAQARFRDEMEGYRLRPRRRTRTI